MSDEWIKTRADRRRVKFTNQELDETAFLTAQVEGNKVVYSILLTNAKNPLSREEVETHFAGELSKPSPIPNCAEPAVSAFAAIFRFAHASSTAFTSLLVPRCFVCCNQASVSMRLDARQASAQFALFARRCATSWTTDSLYL